MEPHRCPGHSIWDTDASTGHKLHHSIHTGGEASDLTQFTLQVPVCSMHLLLNLSLELISIPLASLHPHSWQLPVPQAGLTCNPLSL